ncbi:putative disease resistance protein RGA3 [Telopea speciosissima]|uniref:putative disease resistance protein RGA3 n=1 Tax=Telopea speciosissima TaxID=54955 RepID=UPI001CC5E4D0|nr:putative disease resistance protein RGA3 [Telopea speciosissima]
MAENLVSHVIKQLDMIIKKEINQEISVAEGVKKDFKKLFRTLTEIKDVLKEAEKKQFKNDSVRVWLQDLKQVVYDIDDVLDEWRSDDILIKSSSKQIDGVVVDEDASSSSSINPTKKVLFPSNLFSPFFSSSSSSKHHHDIGHRIKEINKRLDRVASLRSKFHFQTPKQNVRDLSCRVSRRTNVDRFLIRREEHDIIISKLLSGHDQGSSTQRGDHKVVSSDEIPKIISIVSMPGMGKTTLARRAFNDGRVKNHFNKRIWVHVSKTFNKKKVAMRIIGQFGGGGGNGNITITTQLVSWEDVRHLLNSCVDGKNFLLVLDDVWNEDSSLWEPLWLSLKRGSQASRIIITTCKESVAGIMGTTYLQSLGKLSTKDCWSLLKDYAFNGKGDEEREELKETGMKLANKCNGMPFSLKTLGILLYFKGSIKEWQSQLNSDVWSTVASSVVDKTVLPPPAALLLVYNDLSSNLKLCLAYCSLIPRDYYIGKLSTIYEWIAQGFLDDEGLTEELDLIGNKKFDDLEMFSLFQKDAENSKYYQMHDFVRDFTKSLSENECFTLTIKDTNAPQEFNHSRARHLYLLMEDQISTIPPFVYKAKNLRTLKIFGQILSVSSQLCHHLPCLRTLDLSGTSLEELPNEIEMLIHLRYLNLSEARFKELPKSMTSLCNLQILYLSRCRNLCKLPEGIGELLNLMYLDLTECHQLRYLPEGIGRLSKLRLLSDFIIGGVERGGCKIGELKDLNLLRGFLRIIGLERVENGDEVKMLCLKNRRYLHDLYFYFNQYTGCSGIDEEGGIGGEEEVDGEGKTEGGEKEAIDDGGGDTLSKRMEDVLENLQPHEWCQKLIIKDYPGALFPNWMRGHLEFRNFYHLQFLELSGCRKCVQLPPSLGKLHTLRTLIITGMDKFKFLGADFFGINGGATTSDGSFDTIFPMLTVFKLARMQNLEEWDDREIGTRIIDVDENFPNNFTSNYVHTSFKSQVLLFLVELVMMVSFLGLLMT